MKKWFGSFQKKISIAFVLLSAAFVLLTTVIAVAVLVKGYRAQTGERLAFEQRQLITTFGRVAANANDCANDIIMQLNTDKRISLIGIAQSTQSERAGTEYMLGVAKNNLRLLPGINSINILLTNGFLYAAAENKPISFSEISAETCDKIMRACTTTKGCFVRLGNAGYNADSLFYCKQLRDITTNHTVGMVYLELLPKTLARYCQTGVGSAVVLTDDTGEVIVTTMDIGIGSHFTVPNHAEDSLRLGDTTWLWQTGKIDRTNWRLTCLLDEKIAFEPIHHAVGALLLTAFALLCVMTLTTVLIARTLSRPVRELSAHMISNRGNLPLAIPAPHSDDEIATLYANFNSMLAQNKQLFVDFKEEQKQKIRTELALVQSQIKPHFLYNTLDTIYCLASMNRTEEAGAVTKALADYYRLVLNSGEDKITVERELSALKQYLAIMQVRYRGMFESTVECDESVKRVIIPKLLLQPLVENAIYHGIKPKMKSGKMKICVKQVDGAVEFTVTDDGVGMTQEQFEKALCGTNRQEDGETFGMHSVARRVQLFYGENSRLSLHTEDGLTTVMITIHPEEVRDV